jgi:hypothetical protein
MNVWHKDGAVAQIEAMAEWLDEPLDSEHRAKVQANLRASGGRLREAVEALDRLRRAADAWDADLSSYCDGPERDELRAASLIAARFVERS